MTTETEWGEDTATAKDHLQSPKASTRGQEPALPAAPAPENEMRMWQRMAAFRTVGRAHPRQVLGAKLLFLGGRDREAPGTPQDASPSRGLGGCRCRWAERRAPFLVSASPGPENGGSPAPEPCELRTKLLPAEDNQGILTARP